MRDIQGLRKKYFEELTGKHLASKKETLSIEDENRIINNCMMVAETKAYIDTVLPEEHRKYTIFDFNGKTNNNKKVIDSDIALRAKNLVCKYCWGRTWEKLLIENNGEEGIKKYVQKESLMMKRLTNGNHVAIFGQSLERIGRTFLASVILKEAIKLRLRYPGCRTHTYDWVDFTILKKELYEDKDDCSAYRTVDWLVVDNINSLSISSDAQRNFIMDNIDPFFLSRVRNKLPTILVFKFDIRHETIELDKKIGTGMVNMLYNDKTCKIPLT